MQSKPLPSSLSIVVPVFNEEENLPLLHDQLSEVLKKMNMKWEILFVDDGSTDRSPEVLEELARKSPETKVIRFRRNFGQTAAMVAGVRFASGDVIIPMDGDLQNDPNDIPRLLEKLNEGYDVVSGWRMARKDSPLKRNFLSRVANGLISWVSGVHLHDYGCSLKAYRAQIVKEVNLYGEMHRFIPVYASLLGAKVTELPVNHRARQHGVSKYGMERIFKVILDLMVVQFLARYAQKPIYIFGSFGLLNLAVAFMSGCWALWLKYVRGWSFIITPLPLLVAMCSIMGIMCILMGLLAELMIRTYYESQGKAIYSIAQMTNIQAG